MRDIIPPKSFKPKISDVERIKKKRLAEESFKMTEVKKPRRKWSKILIIFFLFVVLLGVSGAAFYFFYIKGGAVGTEKKSEPQEESGDQKVKEIEKMLGDVEESVNSTDQEESDLNSPTLDLNISL